MSRLSFRPRPVDFHKKLPIIRSVQEFEDDETLAAGASTRNSQLLRIAADTANEVHQVTSRKISSEIPTPQYNVVDTYERDYTCTFSQPNSYLRGRGARGELGEFVEYDLDSDDEDWLQEFNNEKRILSPEKLEALLCKLEVLDHRTRERAGVIPTFGVPVPVYLQLDAAAEVWDVFSNKEVVDIVASAPTRATAARALVESAVRAWRLKFPTSKSDDCAVVCLYFDPPSSSYQAQGDSIKTPEEPKETMVSSLTDEQDNSSFVANGVQTYNSSFERSCGFHATDDEIVPLSEEPAMEKLPGRSQSRRSLADCISTTEEEEWSALEGVTRANSLLNVPRFLSGDRKSTSRRKWW